MTYGNYDYSNLPEFLKACPYTKSKNKGNPHLWFKMEGIDATRLKTGDWKNANDNLSFCDGELLTRMTWEYKMGNVYNWNGDIPTLQWSDIKTLLKADKVKKWEDKVRVVQPISFGETDEEEATTDEEVVAPNPTTAPPKVASRPAKTKTKMKHDAKYEEIKDHVENISEAKYLKTGKYDDWIHIMWALRSLEDNDYKAIAIDLAKRCGRDKTQYVDTYWNNYSSAKGWTVATIFHYSKMSDEKAYNALKIKYGSSSSKTIYSNLTVGNMMKFASESDFADVFYNQFKNNLVLDGANLYLYYNNE